MNPELAVETVTGWALLGGSPATPCWLEASCSMPRRWGLQMGTENLPTGVFRVGVQVQRV